MENGIENKLGDVASGSLKTVKWVIGLLAAVVILAGSFWLVFYSNFTANFPFIINLRANYLSIYRKVTGKSGIANLNPIYVIQVEPELNGIKYYSFSGTYSNIDISKGLVYVKGTDGKIYAFRYGNNLTSMDNGTLIPANTTISQPQTARTTIAKDNIINIDNTPYTSNSKIAVSWDDARTLSQILGDYSKDPNIPLNADSSDLFKFIKIN